MLGMSNGLSQVGTGNLKVAGEAKPVSGESENWLWCRERMVPSVFFLPTDDSILVYLSDLTKAMTNIWVRRSEVKQDHCCRRVGKAVEKNRSEGRKVVGSRRSETLTASRWSEFYWHVRDRAHPIQAYAPGFLVRNQAIPLRTLQTGRRTGRPQAVRDFMTMACRKPPFVCGEVRSRCW